MDPILEYDKLIYDVIKRYCYNKNDIEDLYHEGIIALKKAAKNYKTNSNSSFSTYAYFYIKGEILKYIRENKVIKVSKDLIKLNSLINRTRDALEQKYKRAVSIEEIAMFLELPIEKVNDTIMANEYVKSLEYELNDEGNELNLYDSIGYIEKGYNEDYIDLRTEVNKLNDFEKRLIDLRYYQDKTQQETSKELGISQVQVSRKEDKILTKLRSRCHI